MTKHADGYVFGAKPGRVLTKLGYFVSPPMNQHPMSILRGVALGFVATATYVPVISTLISRMLAITAAHLPYFQKVGEWQMKQVMVKPDESYNSNLMHHRYGLDSLALRELEQEIKTKQRGVDISHHWAELLLDRDTDGRKAIFVNS